MNNVATHPDFLRVLSASQKAWCAANKIEVLPNAGWGFFFKKGEHYVNPVAANATAVTISTPDRSEDGDGEVEVGSYPRLRDALKALVAMA